MVKGGRERNKVEFSAFWASYTVRHPVSQSREGNFKIEDLKSPFCLGHLEMKTHPNVLRQYSQTPYNAILPTISRTTASQFKRCDSFSNQEVSTWVKANKEVSMFKS